MDSPRSRLSYANVLSTIAVLIAIGGGSAYAVDKFDGSSISKRSIPGNRLEKGSVQSKEVENLLAKDFKAGHLPTGAQGPAGATGAQGPQGPAGASGANGATNVVIRDAATPTRIASGTAGQSLANCVGSEKAVGGGASWVEVATSGMRLLESSPLGPAGTAATSWLITASNDTGADKNVRARVVCASP